jgi:hypothetical protein
MFPIQSPAIPDSRAETNRANAQHSTGPATAAGKETSRYNATRHGLTNQVACMTWEDRDAFNQFCAAIVADHRPETHAESQLANAIAENNWRLNRARAIEHNIFALGSAFLNNAPAPPILSDDPQIDSALLQAQTFRDEAKTFALITLGLVTGKAQRIQRTLQRNLERLRQLQAERHAARERALEELIELREFRRLRGIAEPPPETQTNAQQEANPSPSGFVFSPLEIDLAIFRRRRANAASLAPLLASQHSNRPNRRSRDAA